MNYNSTLVIIIIVVSISLLTWLVSIWQYDAMMSSMMTFYYNPAELSLFVAIWTAGMAAMMFPAIVPMILIYNRLIETNGSISNNNQIVFQKRDNDREGKGHNNDITHSIENAQEKNNVIDSLKYKLKIKSSVPIMPTVCALCLTCLRFLRLIP